jgi:hypothetical protein
VILLLTAAGLVQGATISVAPAAAWATPGDPLTLDVDISSITNLYSYQFSIQFDPTVLKATSVTEGGFLPSAGSTLFLPGTMSSGSISFVGDVLLGSLDSATGSGTLATLHFTMLMKGTSAVTLSDVLMLDSGLSDIEAAIQNGQVGAGPTGVPEPGTSALAAIALAGVLVLRMVRRSNCRHLQ